MKKSLFFACCTFTFWAFGATKTGGLCEKGGKFEFEMDGKPTKEWASGAKTVSYSPSNEFASTEKK